MKDTTARKSGLHESIRLITVLLFFLFLTPGLLLPPRRPGFPDSRAYYLAYALICLIFLGMELTEYLRWSYRYKKTLQPRIFFFIRLGLILLPVLLYLLKITTPEFFWHLHASQLFILMSLLPFYAYFAFPRKVSLAFLIVSVLLSLSYELLVKGAGDWEVVKLGFLMYRTLTYVIFYALAWLLDRQKKDSEENRQLMEELRASESRLREYAGRIAHTVALEERTRIARDIHDSLGHSLTAIKIQLTKAIAYADVDREEADRAVKAAKATADDAMSDIRDSLKGLNGKEAVISLKDSLPLLVQRLEENGIEVDYTFEGSERDYNYSVLMGLYRFVQEGVTNILKHASPGRVKLTVTFGQEEGMITLADDGRGFTMNEKHLWSEEADHYGLMGLVRRIELVRGRMTVQSSPGGGTVLSASVPRDPVSLLGEKK